MTHEYMHCIDCAENYNISNQTHANTQQSVADAITLTDPLNTPTYAQCWQMLTPALALSRMSWTRCRHWQPVHYLMASLSHCVLSTNTLACGQSLDREREKRWGHEGRWGLMRVDLWGKVSVEEWAEAQWWRKIRASEGLLRIWEADELNRKRLE